VGWGIWTEKYYIYWLLLLVWAVVSRFSSRTKTDRWVVLGLLAFTAMLIVASGRSLRALGIFACGVAVYFLLTKVAVSRRRLKFGLLALLVWWGAAPWLFNAVDFSKVDRRINERTRIYRATHDLVAQQPWLGHGFGRARELTHPLLPRRFQQHFPGGHPHNLGLLFWLEYGLVGAVWLGGVTWILLRRVIDAAHGTEIWPALAALIVTFVTMVSFSWDIWDLNIILFYAAAAGLVILVLGSIQSSAAGLTDGEKGRS
jgi:O-antigen ligase